MGDVAQDSRRRERYQIGIVSPGFSELGNSAATQPHDRKVALLASAWPKMWAHYCTAEADLCIFGTPNHTCALMPANYA